MALDCALELVPVESWMRCLGSVNLSDTCLQHLFSSVNKPNSDAIGQRACTAWRSRECVVWPEWENNCTVTGEGNALHGEMQDADVIEEELVRVTSWFNFLENT